MGKTFKIGFLGLLVVGALVVVMTGAVLAQEETPMPTPKLWDGPRIGRGIVPHSGGFGHGLDGQVGLEAAAEALGMDAEELSTQIWGGKSLADLAEEKGVDLQEVQDAVIVAQEQAMKDAIQQAVENGDLDQDHADWLLEGLEKGYLGGHGFDGFGGCHGRSGFGARGSSGRFRGNSGFGRFPDVGNGITGTRGA
jgi:hypothetical protein